MLTQKIKDQRSQVKASMQEELLHDLDEHIESVLDSVQYAMELHSEIQHTIALIENAQWDYARYRTSTETYIDQIEEILR